MTDTLNILDATSEVDLEIESLNDDRCECPAQLDRIAELSPDVASALNTVIDAAETIDERYANLGSSSLRALVQQVMEDSVYEFFTSSSSSSSLPHQFRDRLEPAPFGVPLPAPAEDLDLSLAEALDARVSRRSFANEPIALEDLSTCLYYALGSRGTEAGYGVAGMPMFRFPSIGGLAGLEFDLLVNNVEGLDPGRYRYDPVGHALTLIDTGDYRPVVVNAVFETDWIFHASVVVVCVIDQARTAWKYKTRSYRFAHVDLGAAVQNLLVVTNAVGLYSCPIAAFFDDELNNALQIERPDKYVGLLVPIGSPPRFVVQ